MYMCIYIYVHVYVYTHMYIHVHKYSLDQVIQHFWSRWITNLYQVLFQCLRENFNNPFSLILPHGTTSITIRRQSRLFTLPSLKDQFVLNITVHVHVQHIIVHVHVQHIIVHVQYSIQVLRSIVLYTPVHVRYTPHILYSYVYIYK